MHAASFERTNAAYTALNMDLIASVKARPEMWQSQHPQHWNRGKNKASWKEISKELDADVPTLRKRWKHLKDQYRKELKKAIEKDLTEVSWQYFEPLYFLKEEVLRDKNKPQEEEEESDAEPEVSSKVRVVEPDNMKLHMIYTGIMETKSAVEERMKSLDDLIRHDPDYMYLMSLLPTIRQLSEIQKLQLKGKINDWLLEAITSNEYVPTETKYVPN